MEEKVTRHRSPARSSSMLGCLVHRRLVRIGGGRRRR